MTSRCQSNAKTRVGFCVFATLTMLICCSVVSAQQLSPEQQEILKSLDQQEIEDALAIVGTVVKWRDRIRGASTDEARIEVALAIAEEAKKLQGQFPELAAPIDHSQKISPILAEAERTWQNAEYTIEEFEGFTEENFREEAKRRAMLAASEQLTKVFEETIVPQLEKLQDPAKYAKNFVEGEFRQWVSQPIALGGDDSLQARIIPPSDGSPIFGQSTEYGAEIVYMDDFTVNATGIYLEFEPGQSTPRININKMRVEADLKQSVLNNVKSLGNEFLSSSGMPIKVTLNGKPDFSQSNGGRRGGISFNVEIGILGGDTVRATGENLLLYPGNQVDWKGAALEISVRTEAPVPIGTTPFAMWKIIGKLNPSTKEITLGTQISTAATPPEVVGLDVRLTTQIPVKSLKLKGHLIVGTLEFMQTEGIIDFEKGEIAGEFRSSDEGSPLSQLVFANGSFSLKRERFLADGQVDLFGKRFAEMHCELDFVEGRGELYANSGFDLFGVDFSSTLSARIDPGFSRVRLEAVQSLTVARMAPFGSIGVVVTVTADSATPDKVHVIAEAFGQGLKAEFDVPTLAGCTIDVLRRELEKQATKGYHQFLKDLAQGEKDGREFAAKIDKQTREYVDEKLGITWHTGNPELDKLGGDLSREFKNAGGALTDAREQLGGGVTDLREGIQDFGSKLEKGAGKIFSGGGPF